MYHWYNLIITTVSLVQWAKCDTGCIQAGTVIHKEMQGGLGNSGQPIALTAFILVSLLEAGINRSVSISVTN